MIDDPRGARYSDLFGSAGSDPNASDHDAPPGREHSGHEASNCAYCPICAAIGVLRTTRPDVLEHLTVAARELVAAAAIILEEAGRTAGNADAARPAEPKQSGVRRIEVS